MTNKVARGGLQEITPVCALVARKTGCSLSPQQVFRLREKLAGKVSHQAEAAYAEFLGSSEGAKELLELMAAISVHKTDLFRDDVQLTAFTEAVLKPLARLKRPLRLWSAGCATGEEVATLLVLLNECGAHPDSTVLGTDLSPFALAQAKKLCFHPEMAKRVPKALLAKHFALTPEGYSLSSELGARAQFLQHNLMETPYPLTDAGGKFDVIFCRNVLIYFTDQSFDFVTMTLAERLTEGGTLVLSSAEPILRQQPMLQTLRLANAFFYRRREAGPLPSQPAGFGLLTRPPARSPTPPPTPIRLEVILSVEAPKQTSVAAKPAAPRSGEAAPTDGEPAQAPSAKPPREEALFEFERILDGGEGAEDRQRTEKSLRQCLYLDPDLGQARYLLGMLLEQNGRRADAAGEYRRALATLTDGKCPQISFFLNNDRLKAACSQALKRLGY